MKINEYQELALRTANKNKTQEDMLLNGALGLTGEAGEVADIIKKWKFQGHELNVEKIRDELGDVCWYIALMANAIDVSLEVVLLANINKLMLRYPEGFSTEKSLNRVD